MDFRICISPLSALGKPLSLTADVFYGQPLNKVIFGEEMGGWLLSLRVNVFTMYSVYDHNNTQYFFK